LKRLLFIELLWSTIEVVKNDTMAYQDFFPKGEMERITREGTKIYETIKDQYEPQHYGKYLAIDPESKDAFMDEDGAQAVLKAKEKYPKRVFFLVKIGYAAADTLMSLYHYV